MFDIINNRPNELIYLGNRLNKKTSINYGLFIDVYQYKSCIIQIILNKEYILDEETNKKVVINELIIINPLEPNKGIATKALDMFIEKYSSKYDNLYAYDMFGSSKKSFFNRYAKKRKLKEAKGILFDGILLYNLKKD